MSHKNSKNKQNQSYKGYNQNQQASSSAEDQLMTDKYQNNSNAQE